jgi:hypothetical protein
MSARDRRTSRRGATEEAPEEPSAEAAPSGPPLSTEEGRRAYREKVNAILREREAVLEEHGGSREGLPPVPKPDDLARFKAEKAAAPPHEVTDEELGLGELGISERRIRGVGAAWNFTIGPTFIYEGPQSIAALQEKIDPVVVVAKYIPEEEYKKIDRTRVRGVVLEEGSIIDPVYWLLRDENRASIVSAKGALEMAVNEELCVVDGVRGAAIFGPSPRTVADYTHLRALGPPPEDPLLKETFRQLASAVMGSRFRDQKKPPFEFPEYERLTDIARRARKGQPITKEDDDWMKGIILQGFPTPEEMIQKAKKPTEIKDEPAAPAPKAGRAAEAAKEKEGAGAAKAGEKGAEAAAPDEGPKSEAESRRAKREAEIAAQRAARGGEKKEEMPAAEEAPKPAEPKPEPRPEPKREARAAPAPAPAPAAAPEPPRKEDAAAARRAQREAEIAAQRAARKGGDKDKKEGEAKPAEPAKDAGGGAEEPFDPLADMV